MRERWLPRLVWAVAIAIAVPGAFLMGSQMVGIPMALAWVITLALVAIGSATAGGVLASRLPSNAVGWLLLAMGIGTGLLMACIGYSDMGISGRVDLPAATVQYTAWATNWLGVPAFYGTISFLLLLFPDGRLPSPRWRWVAIFAASSVAAAIVLSALWPPSMEGIPNPISPRDPTALEVVRTVATATDWLALPVLAATAAALVVRFRRSRGIERQQLKWIAYTATISAAGLALSVAGPEVTGDVAFLIGLMGLASLPLAIALAILRYRLYAIDVVINRTLVYGFLTVSLGATYLASVILLQLTLEPITRGSGVAIAASTLAVAALFRPARARIQRFVDRRFYRQRYDARRTMEDFGARLRHELDLETLGVELCGVVRDTMQPNHVSLWLRPVDRNDSRTAGG